MPVLSVQITVIAPIVSLACIFRTRLFVRSIRRMLTASDSVTLIGNPSGTDTTISVTATMKIFKMCEIRSMTGMPDEDSRTFVSSAIKVMVAIA